MSPKPTRAVLITLLPFLLAWAPAMADTPEADGGRAYARAQLIREARRIVRPDNVVSKDTAAAAAALAEDVQLRAGWQATTEEERSLLEAWSGTIVARRLLLGDPATVDDEGQTVPATEGALRQARLLLRWLLADVPEHQGCGVFVRDPRARNPADRERGFEYPELPPPAAEAAQPPTPAVPPGTDNGAGAEPGAGPGTVPGAAAPAAPVPAAPRAPTLEQWARAVRTSVGGSLLGMTIVPAICEDVSRLLEADKTPTPISEPSVPGLRLKRHALEASEPFTYDAAFVAMRRLQAGEWVEAIRADSPAEDLVDEGTVREKVQRAEEYVAQLKALEQERDALLARLDDMVADLDNWKTMAAILAVRIQDRRAEVDRSSPPTPPDGGSPPPPDLMLRVLSAQETTVALEMRLLYLAAARSEARLGLLKDKARPSGLLEQLIQVARDELATAQASRALYEEALDRVRRERRLDRLQSEARRIRGRIEALDQGEVRPQAPPERKAAYRALLEVNGVVQETVRARRALGDWAQQVSPKRPGETQADDPLAFARAPAAAAWDAATLGRWHEMLARPEFDADLVAEHYAVGEKRLRRLRDTLRAAVDAGTLRERFVAAAGAAERALAPLVERRDWALRTYRLADFIETWRRDFDDSFDGMQKERDRIAAQQAAIVQYQRELLDLGSRSFGIRVVRDLEGEDLAAAGEDALDALASAGRWTVLEDPETNAWQFLKDHWLGILGVLAAALAVIAGTPRARRAIDRWLAARAARYPQLEWAGASVSREREDAQARKQQEQAAAAARTAELLRRAEAEERGGSAPGPDAVTERRCASTAESGVDDEDGPDQEKKSVEVS